MSSFGSFLQTHMCQGLLGSQSSLSELQSTTLPDKMRAALWVLCPKWLCHRCCGRLGGGVGNTSDTVSAPALSPHLRQQEAPDLFQWLCSDSLKLCCPSGTFGPSCLREFFQVLLGARRELLGPGGQLWPRPWLAL